MAEEHQRPGCTKGGMKPPHRNPEGTCVAGALPYVPGRAASHAAPLNHRSYDSCSARSDCLRETNSLRRDLRCCRGSKVLLALNTIGSFAAIREDRSTPLPLPTSANKRAAGQTAARRRGAADQPDGRRKARQRGQESLLASWSGGIRRWPFRQSHGRDAFLHGGQEFLRRAIAAVWFQLSNSLAPLQARSSHCGEATTSACWLQRLSGRGILRRVPAIAIAKEQFVLLFPVGVRVLGG